MKCFLLGLIVEVILIIISLITKQMWIFTRGSEVVLGLTVLLGAAASRAALGDTEGMPAYSKVSLEEVNMFGIVKKYIYFGITSTIAIIISYLFV
ncbi:hypothetical protein [Clostridium fungisolvens]|uniref:Uncharacterized protein n=1 Tax=Clostridium fungisolvens TaxID=1604897 RepID=A0A6V8SM31_9CLOT|nr:hypothetical protein [Clostridium fungisolvens]GFP78304.1 hypothetical protein bsdtw1_04522 [Clostridium fungisolvens]